MEVIVVKRRSFEPMLSKAQVKDIRLLGTVKGRIERKAFIAEGDKIVKEWLKSGTDIALLIATKEWLIENDTLLAVSSVKDIIPVSIEDLSRVSTLKSPNDVLITVPITDHALALPEDGWVLALDNVQDPGNVGTLIRIADWFGISHVIASPGSADFYNSKVVQAAMGGHLRVQLHVAELYSLLTTTQLPIIAATLNGENIYTCKKPEKGILIIGNESKGISEELINISKYKVTIPRKGGAESLNAGVSAGILCALLLGS